MEAYEDIVGEIKELDEEDYPQEAYLVRRGIGRGNCDYNSSAYALDIAQRVRDAVAHDYTEWYQLDVAGNKIHVGDTVRSLINGAEYTVEGFGIHDALIVNLFEDGTWEYVSSVRKVVPDTQKNIDDDATLAPYAYCDKYGLFPIQEDNEDRETMQTRMVKHLLERQRKLCEVENA